MSLSSSAADTTTHTLYEHQRHPHQPQNVNELLHAEEQLGMNARLALFITNRVGTMWCAYVFAGIGVGSLVGVFTNNLVLGLACGALSSYFIQLVLLPIIMLGQNIQSRHSELLAEQQYLTTQKTYHDTEQIMKHMDAQDSKLLQLEKQNALILTSLEQSRSRLVKSGARNAKRHEEEEEEKEKSV